MVENRHARRAWLLALLALQPVAGALAEESVNLAAPEALMSRLVIEPLIPIGEEAQRWVVPPGGTGSSEQFLCSVTFDVLESVASGAGVAIVEPVPDGLEYLPGSATGPGARIELSTDAGLTFRPESEVSAGGERITHIRWVLGGPLAPGMRGRVSFRAQLAAGPSTGIPDG